MKKGFTLIELLVVIAIIAMLSTLSVVALNSARQKSRDARRVSDIKQIRTALEMYFDKAQEYPSGSAITLGNSSYECLSANGWVASTSCTSGATVYMQRVPKDPVNTGTKVYTYTRGGGNATYTISYWPEGTGATTTATEVSMQ